MTAMIKPIGSAANGSMGDSAASITMSDVNDAAYRIAHQFPGGVPALAQRMGMSRNTLAHKVSLTTDTHKLALAEAVHMQEVANRFDILYAMAESLNHVCMPATQMSEGEINTVLGDGRVTPNERRKVAAQVAEAVQALCAVMRVL